MDALIRLIWGSTVGSGPVIIRTQALIGGAARPEPEEAVGVQTATASELHSFGRARDVPCRLAPPAPGHSSVRRRASARLEQQVLSAHGSPPTQAS